MGSLKIRVDVSFVLLGCLALLGGGGRLFAAFAVCLFLHESSHFFAAEKLNFSCREMRFSAFGAVLFSEADQAEGSAAVKIALAGPLANLFCAFVIAGLWWFEPSTYEWTEEMFAASVTLGAVNLLPCYPMDGGRVLFALVSKKIGKKKTLSLCDGITCAVSAVVATVFAFSLSQKPVYSLGLFAAFLMLSLFSPMPKNLFVWTGAVKSAKKMEKGMEKKTLVFSQNATLARLMSRLNGNALYCVEVVDKKLATLAFLSPVEVDELVCSHNSDETLKQCLKL